jgi:hypothetical protein
MYSGKIAVPPGGGGIVVNTEYLMSDNVPDGIKNATHNTLSNFRKKLATEIKISSFFRK